MTDPRRDFSDLFDALDAFWQQRQSARSETRTSIVVAAIAIIILITVALSAYYLFTGTVPLAEVLSW